MWLWCETHRKLEEEWEEGVFKEKTVGEVSLRNGTLPVFPGSGKCMARDDN